VYTPRSNGTYLNSPFPLPDHPWRWRRGVGDRVDIYIYIYIYNGTYFNPPLPVLFQTTPGAGGAASVTVWMNRIDSHLRGALALPVFQTWNPACEPRAASVEADFRYAYIYIHMEYVLQIELLCIDTGGRCPSSRLGTRPTSRLSAVWKPTSGMHMSVYIEGCVCIQIKLLCTDTGGGGAARLPDLEPGLRAAYRQCRSRLQVLDLRCIYMRDTDIPTVHRYRGAMRLIRISGTRHASRAQPVSRPT